MDLQCWKCGHGVSDLPMPLGRRETCPACNADLHACRMCRFFDTSVAKSCREPVADEVRDKERANFCGYLEPRPDAHAPAAAGTSEAEKALADLFGLPDGAASGSPRDADEARRRLEDLFDDKDR